MNNILSIVIGVVSGVITSAFLYIAVQIFRKIVIPWYQDVVYKGIDLTGEWHVVAQRFSQDIVWDISQNAHRLTGRATVMAREEFQVFTEKLKLFDLQGNISNRLVSLTLQHSDKTRIGLVTVLLEVKGDGRTMEGSYTFYSATASKILATECTAYRGDSMVIHKQRESKEALSESKQLVSDQKTSQETIRVDGTYKSQKKE